MSAGAPSLTRSAATRARTAQVALGLCAQVDALGREVAVALAQEELPPLQPLLAHRGLLLGQLAGHVAQLRRTAPTADRADGEDRMAEADPLLEAVLAALEQTAAETARVEALLAGEVTTLRGELDTMQRAAASASPYGGSPAARGVGVVTPAWGVGVAAPSPSSSRINFKG
ncbi:MAG: hypothetical protein KJT01_09700 [Gemmatimonadetes bacterium]|nr:hypothetical protein [Gemmatimonadota bacterium]